MQHLQNRAEVAPQDDRWAALLARDPHADGSFFYAVTTTGVFCRPSCGSRRPLRENVRFFETTRAAEAAGFRPCKRCKPNQPQADREHAQKMEEACRLIETALQEPSLQQLASAAGLSESHFHRVFRASLGLTPKQYATAARSGAVRKRLAQSGTVTEAIYDGGFNSSGRFYASSNGTLGMTPSTYRKGGEAVEITFAIGESSLGSVLVAQSVRGICAILMGDDPQELARDLERRFPRAQLIAGDAALDDTVAKVIGLVETPGTGLGLPLDIRGTAFQQRVWQALQALPLGSTTTYQQLADTIGMPKAVRAVAQACAANKIAVAVPCHRVIRTDGGLSGYRWGVERKKLLLEREAFTASRSTQGA